MNKAKFIKLRCGLLLGIGLTFASLSFAQNYTDVTETYLTNAGFNTNCNYKVGGTQVVATADPGNMKTVSGWSVGSNAAWSAAGTFEYGWNGTFNNVSTPKSGTKNETGTGHGTIGFTVGWSGNSFYQQNLTLPIGKYALVFAANFNGATSINNNLTGWAPSGGTPVLSELTTATSLNTWLTDTVLFSITKETPGAIQVGMQAFQSGSGDNAKLFVDFIQLLKVSGDKTGLQQLTDSAIVILNEHEDVLPESTVYEELESIITNAQIVLENDEISDDEILQTEGALELAIEKVHNAIYAYSLRSASIDNPINLTSEIDNPDFEYNGGSTQGWTTTLGIYAGSNAVFDGAPRPNHVLDGDPNTSTVGYQTVSGIPEGIYKVKTIARGRQENGPKMYLSAEPGIVFGSSNRSSTQINRIGDVGGDLNYGFNQYESPFIAVSNDENAITFGIYFEGDCGWSSADNFELYYYGNAATLIAALKEDLTSLKDSSDVPPNYNYTAIDTLLSTPVNAQNLVHLSSRLNDEVQTLKNAITQNIDATLADLKVDGTTIWKFTPDVYAYNYNIYSSTAQTPSVPKVTAIKNSSYAENPVIAEAKEVPGTTTITVTAGNGEQLIYRISFAFIQLEQREDFTGTFDTFQGQYVELSGKGQVTLTGTDPLNESLINLLSSDTWIYFKNVKPSTVMETQLPFIRINGETPIVDSNIRISQYLDGAVVIPHSSTYKAATVYSDPNLRGTSIDLRINQYYKTQALGSMNDNIESFVLRKGYMATFASNTNGTGTSRVYIANESDIIINTMPKGLSNTVSFVVIRQWRWTNKKGWRGSSDGANIFGAGSHYDYNNAAYSTMDVEYVPMRHNPGWNAYSNFLDKFSSTHALGYNEPDNSVDDGFSTVENAIANWPSMMASGLRLGSPAPTDGGLGWLYNFIDECDARGYRVDFVAWHFYRAGYTPTGFYNALKEVHDRTGRPIWITEWNNGCNWTYNGNVPSIEENGEVIKAFTAMLDTTSFVERYFVWDGCNEELRMTNSGTGELYPAGIAYRDQESSISYTDDFYNDQGTATIQEYDTGFCNYTGSIETKNAYTGSGYVDTADSIGSEIAYNVIFKTEGFKTLSLKYSTKTDLYATVFINDTIAAADVKLPSSGSVNNYNVLPITVYTGTGIAAIRIVATTPAGLGNIDYIKVTEASAASCDLTSESYPIVLSASAQQDVNPAKNVLDGVIEDGSRWSADGFPQTIVIDYGAVKSIVGTNVFTFQERTYQFMIELDKHADFSNPYIIDRRNNTNSSQPISDTFDVVEARYARITVTGASDYNGTWVSITEFEIVEAIEPNAVAQFESHPNSLIIYPNPATQNVTVQLPDNFNNAILRIYNTSGLAIKEVEIEAATTPIDISSISKGIYLVKVIQNQEVITQKLIVED